jgi:hypothetical protein
MGKRDGMILEVAQKEQYKKLVTRQTDVHFKVRRAYNNSKSMEIT